MKFVINMLLGLLVTLALSSVSLAYQQAIDSGKDAFKRGQFELAAQYWEQARQHISKNEPKYVDISVALAAAYQKSGLLTRAFKVLESAKAQLGNLNHQPEDTVRHAKLLMQLGEVYVAMRDMKKEGNKDCSGRQEYSQDITPLRLTRIQRIEKAWNFLEQAERMVCKNGEYQESSDEKCGIFCKHYVCAESDHPLLLANILNIEGNIAYRFWELDDDNREFYLEDTLKHYRDSRELANKLDAKLLSAKASINLIQGAAQLNDFDPIRDELEKRSVFHLVEQLPPDDQTFTFIELANSMRMAVEEDPLSIVEDEKRQLYPDVYQYAYDALKKARQLAINQQNNEAIGYANLYLAQIYAEQPRYYQIAQQLIKKALHYMRRIPFYSEGRLTDGDSLVSNRFRMYLPSPLDELPKEKCWEMCQGFSSLFLPDPTYKKRFSKHCKGNCQELPPLFLQNYRPELLVRLDRQLGQLWKKQGQLEKAIQAYQRAIQNLQFRQEYRILSRSIGKLEENVYFELADLFLQQSIQAIDENNRQFILKKAIDTIEAFKAAEVRNYFQDECVTELREKEKVDIEQFFSENPKVAVFYPLLFEDSIELLLVSNQGIAHKGYPLTNIENGKEPVTTTIDELKNNLSQFTNCGSERLPKIYDWFGDFLEKEASNKRIDTLIIVPTGKFYKIPFAALYDDKKQEFLIEKYALIVTPGLKLTDLRKPKKSQRPNRVLLNGLSVPVGGFTKLCYVPGQIIKLSCLLGGQVFNEAGHDALESCLKTACYDKSDNNNGGKLVQANTDLIQCFKNKELEKCPSKGIDIFEDNLFTADNVEKQFCEQIPYSIVHFATHGQFHKEPSKNFLQTYDGRITMDKLREMILANKSFGKPGDLLTLGACETAQGDTEGRSALGLASVALKAKVPSVLATSWIVYEGVSEQIITDFYRGYINNSLSKAKALQKAQMQLLKSETNCGMKGERQYMSPHYWAPYILIGNGL